MFEKVLRVVAVLVARIIALILRVRVTSWKRTASGNAQVGGSPSSHHLYGGALDFGIETPEWKRRTMGLFLEARRHDSGTAPHYHGAGRVVVGGIVGAVVALSIWRRLK